MRSIYPSDITREQFEIIRPILAKKRTHPPAYDLNDIFCAVLYLLKEGCTWRAIPHDFPKWQFVSIVPFLDLRIPVADVVIRHHLFDFAFGKSPEFLGNIVENRNHAGIIHAGKYRFLCHAHASSNNAVGEVAVGLEAGRNKVPDKSYNFLKKVRPRMMDIVDGGRSLLPLIETLHKMSLQPAVPRNALRRSTKRLYSPSFLTITRLYANGEGVFDGGSR